MGEKRLGDVIDDHCIKCRRVTNHSIVSLVDAEAAKVRCRTCYHDHDYRHEQAPPTKKELKKMEADALAAAEAAAAEKAAPDGVGKADSEVDAISDSEVDAISDSEVDAIVAEPVPEPSSRRVSLKSRRA